MGTSRDMTPIAVIAGVVLGVLIGGFIGLIVGITEVQRLYGGIMGGVIGLITVTIFEIWSNGLSHRDLMYALTCIPVGFLIGLVASNGSQAKSYTC